MGGTYRPQGTQVPRSAAAVPQCSGAWPGVGTAEPGHWQGSLLPGEWPPMMCGSQQRVWRMEWLKRAEWGHEECGNMR